MRIPSFSHIFRLCGISSLQRLSIERRRNISKLDTFAIVFSIQCRKMSKKVSDYGTWKSVISSQLACSGGAAYSSDLQVDPITGSLFWSEVRSKEGGRCVVVSYNPDTCETVVWTPEGFNVRSRVHEYGGGAFLVHNGRLYFSNNQDQRLYRQDGPNQTPIPLIPPQLQLRFADGHYCPKHNKIFCVAEDHSVLEKGATQPENRLVCVDPENEGAPITIEEGADFYSGPRVSPDGTRLVWMQWNHPNMEFFSLSKQKAETKGSGEKGKDKSPKKTEKPEKTKELNEKDGTKKRSRSGSPVDKSKGAIPKTKIPALNSKNLGKPRPSFNENLRKGKK